MEIVDSELHLLLIHSQTRPYLLICQLGFYFRFISLATLIRVIKPRLLDTIFIEDLKRLAIIK